MLGGIDNMYNADEEIGKLIQLLLKEAHDNEEIIYLVEESTGKGITLYDYVNSNKHAIEKNFILKRD